MQRITIRQIKGCATDADLQSLLGNSDITLQDIAWLTSLTGDVQTQINSKFSSSNVHGYGDVTWSSDTIVATAKAVKDMVDTAIASAQIGGVSFKGAWSAKTSPEATPILKGYSYVYDIGTAPTGVVLEQGDYLIAKVDINTSAAVLVASNWVIVQTNIDGALTTIDDETATDGKYIKQIKKGSDGHTIQVVKGNLPSTVNNARELLNVSNGVATLAHTPVSGSLFILVNGLVQRPTADYTQSGTTITFVNRNDSPMSSDEVEAQYQY